MKRKIGLMALALALSAGLVGCSNTASNESPNHSAPAVAPTESANPSPAATPNTVTKGMEEAARGMGEAARGVGDAARGAVNDVGRMTQKAGSEIQNAMR